MSSEDKKDQLPSQIEPNDFVRNLLVSWDIKQIKTVDDLAFLRAKLSSRLERKPYNETTREQEKQIRWKRTGAQIIEDGYVYKGKSCTDLVLAFMTLARATGINETRFVKLKTVDSKRIHSLCEVKLSDGWYIFDIANDRSAPVKGEINESLPWNFPGVEPLFLWKRGRDSWDLELTDYNSKQLIEI